MKRLFITAALLIALGIGCNAQESKSNVTVTKQGKTFTGLSIFISSFYCETDEED